MMASSLGDPSLRRSSSLPLRGDNRGDAVKTSLRHSKSEDIQQQHKLDRYGFILNIDSQGGLRNGNADDEDNNLEDGRSPVSARKKGLLGSGPTLDAATIQRRVKKWEIMLSNWSIFRSRRKRLVKKRLRKGIPDEQRSSVWPVLCNVDEKISQNPGLYIELVKQSVGGTCGANDSWKTTEAAASNRIEAQLASSRGSSLPKEAANTKNGQAPVAFNCTKSFKVIQDTIERDIHRTFPRHSMFYKSDDDVEDEDLSRGPGNSSDDSEGVFPTDLCGTAEIRTMIRELNSSRDSANAQQQHYLIHTGNANGDTFDPAQIFEGMGGQSRLRRVLKAYSTYDREIGYCQGMNFIAAMFLTLVSEEKAFWMLVCESRSFLDVYLESCALRWRKKRIRLTVPSRLGCFSSFRPNFLQPFLLSLFSRYAG